MESNPECPRCAQVAQGLELLQKRMREKEIRIYELERALDQRDARIEALEKRLTELEQKRHRSAAPFRRKSEERKPDPKRAGPPQGHPPAFRRLPPDAPVETVTVPLTQCPHCAGPVRDLRPHEQVIVDLPPITPIYRRVVFYSGECAQCGRVHSTHPEQVSTATGAAGVHLGARAQALAADLRHGHGLTTRRVCAILREHFLLPLSQGGLCHVLARTAQRLGPDFERLRQEVQGSASVHSDETSWWLGGRPAWLWVLTTPVATLYHISRKRDAATLAEMLGERYAGVLVSDCLNVYDRYAAAQKSKCVAHHMRAIAEAQEMVAGSRLLAGLRRVMGAALRLQGWHDRLPAAVYERGVASLERRLTRLLAPTYENREEERIAERFRRRREAIFTFLHQPEVAATNNLAERQLRPGVITRKLSCGNQTERGAGTWERLASLAATCRQRGESFVALVAQRLILREQSAPGIVA